MANEVPGKKRTSILSTPLTLPRNQLLFTEIEIFSICDYVAVFI